MSVGRICQREVDFADPTESILRIAERMHQRTVGALVILAADRRPIGIVTDRDLTTRVIAACREPSTTTVAEVMTPCPQTIAEDSAIEDALRLMRSGAFRRVPVVDREGHLVGLVTLDDVLMLLCEEFSMIGTLLQRETPTAAANEWARSHAAGRGETIS
jgi:CBS domain-containing protein